MHLRAARLCASLLAGSALSSTLAIVHTLPAQANPTGGTVAAGTASIASAGRALTVTQTSNRAIINWQRFSIGRGETTTFALPSASAAVLDRVTGGDPSVLLGKLSSNGQVYLINPSGVVVGPHGVVNTASFVASTLDLPDAAFLQGGKLAFSGGTTASIVNLGTIQSSAGDVALIALKIVNKGSIEAPNGQAILAAGGQVLYVPDDGSDVLIQPAAAPAAIDNKGLIAAAKVQLRAAGSAYALAVNNGGVVSATAVDNVGGQVVLDGGAGDVVSTGGITAAGPAGAGGAVTLTGGRVAVTGTVNASGPSQGGSIALAAGNAITVTRSAVLRADATQAGNGGHISVKAATATQFDGTASARGGPHGGNGGSAEISGGTLGFTGLVDLTAPLGKTGTLLFDPDSITIDSSSTPLPNSVITSGLWDYSDNPGAQTVGASAIVAELAASDLTLNANQSIAVNAPIVSATTNFLALQAPTVAVNATISLPNGTLNFYGALTTNPGGGDMSVTTDGQSLTSASGATIAAGTVFIGNYAQVSLAGPVQTGWLDVNQSGFTVTSFSATNPGNAIATLILGPGYGPPADAYSGSFVLSTTGALEVEGMANAAGGIAITAAGNLSMTTNDVDQTQLGTSGAQVTLASTGGVFINDVGTSLFTGSGRRVIYSATDSGLYTSGGLGYTEVDPVSYGSDPDSAATNVIYLAASTKLPVLFIGPNQANRYYGQADPVFTALYANGSSANLITLPSFEVLGGADTSPGVYTVQPYGAVAAGYRIYYETGTLVVNPAPLTIASNSATMPFGGTVPALTGTFSGLVLGDTPSTVPYSFSVTFPSSGAAAGAVYPISLNGTDPNYSVTYKAGSLTVGQTTTNSTIPQTPVDTSDPLTSINLGPNTTINTNDQTTTQSVTVNIPVITPTFDWAGLGNDAIPEEDAIVQEYVAEMAGSNPPVTLAGVEGLLAGDSPAALTLKATLMPFVYAQLEAILDEPQSQWTPDQAAFVAGMQAFISEQQQQAAIQAENAYAAWQQQQQDIEEQDLAGLSGPAYVEMADILSSNPPVPPSTFLQLVQGGSALTPQQSIDKLAIGVASSDIGTAVQQTETQQVNAEETWLQANLSNPAQQATLAQAEAQLNSSDPTTVTNAEIAIDSLYQSASGPANPAGFTGGAVSDVAKAVWGLMFVAKGNPSGALRSLLSPQLTKLIFPKSYAKSLSMAKSSSTSSTEGTESSAEETDVDEMTTQVENVLQDTTKTAETVTETVETATTVAEDVAKVTSSLSETLETAGDFLGPLGLALELAGNATQVITAGVEYAQVSQYNTAFTQAVNNANAPVTVADLKAMMSNSSGQAQMMNYISSAMAVGDTSPPTETATKSLSALVSYGY